MKIIPFITGNAQTDRNGLLVAAIFLLGVPVTMYFACVISKSSLKDRFIQAFKLKELP
jgi:hypothetical protein